MEPAERKIGEADPLLGVVFSIEAVRDICQEVLAAGGEHLAEVSISSAPLLRRSLKLILAILLRVQNFGMSGETSRLTY